MDPSYTALISYLQVQLQDPAVADVTVGMSVGPGPGNEENIAIRSTTTGAAWTSGQLLWCPPPIVLVRKDTDVGSGFPRATVFIPNVDTETLNFEGYAYIFDREAADDVPVEVLMACLPRASTII